MNLGEQLLYHSSIDSLLIAHVGKALADGDEAGHFMCRTITELLLNLAQSIEHADEGCLHFIAQSTSKVLRCSSYEVGSSLCTILYRCNLSLDLLPRKRQNNAVPIRFFSFFLLFCSYSCEFKKFIVYLQRKE